LHEQVKKQVAANMQFSIAFPFFGRAFELHFLQIVKKQVLLWESGFYFALDYAVV
jgi:hypothetical protein